MFRRRHADTTVVRHCFERRQAQQLRIVCAQQEPGQQEVRDEGLLRELEWKFFTVCCCHT